MNECSIENGDCEHLCTDFPGGHVCSCFNGFFLTNVYNCTGECFYCMDSNELNTYLMYINSSSYLQTSMSATPPMETVNTTVSTLRETLAAPVTLAMNWTAMDSTALVT